MPALSEFIQRRSERLTARIPLTLLAEFRGRQLAGVANTVDIGNHGFKIETDFPLSPDQPLIVFQRSGDMQPLCCRVVWVHKTLSNLPREVGLEFLGDTELGSKDLM